MTGAPVRAPAKPTILRRASSRITAAVATVALGATAVAAAAYATGAQGPARSGSLLGAAVFLTLVWAVRRVGAARLVLHGDHVEVVNPLRTEVISYADITEVRVSRRGMLHLDTRGGRTVDCVGTRSGLLDAVTGRSSAVDAADRVRAALARSSTPTSPQRHLTRAWSADAALVFGLVCFTASLLAG